MYPSTSIRKTEYDPETRVLSVVRRERQAL
ncbi:hypothetical protein MES5069_650069 [Mesorhizobium escarrei]|uniref:KTSC domain-containing protein n=1 Tax=Mesorhizobium escarrei TaxID=666018 RepID=A0ABM9EFT4_9HYPH|nr:hypothetical protein MES5069_650069 [Mesorhizobium escarrei]